MKFIIVELLDMSELDVTRIHVASFNAHLAYELYKENRWDEAWRMLEKVAGIMQSPTSPSLTQEQMDAIRMLWLEYHPKCGVGLEEDCDEHATCENRMRVRKAFPWLVPE